MHAYHNRSDLLSEVWLDVAGNDHLKRASSVGRADRSPRLAHVDIRGHAPACAIAGTRKILVAHAQTDRTHVSSRIQRCDLVPHRRFEHYGERHRHTHLCHHYISEAGQEVLPRREIRQDKPRMWYAFPTRHLLQPLTSIEHLKDLLDNAQQEALKQYTRLIQNVHRSSDLAARIPKGTPSLLVTLRPNYLCLQCPNVATSTQRDRHEKGHRFCKGHVHMCQRRF